MTKKPKLLWCGDLVAKTGFSRVSDALLPRLRDKYEIVVMASNWHGDPCPDQKLYKMYPASNRCQQAPFGEERIREIVELEKPDLICSLNDPWIVSEQYSRIEDLHKQGRFRFAGYLTMDSYNWTGGIHSHINDWDALIAFTEFGAHEFIKAGINRAVAVIPHGLDPDRFYPIDKKEARKRLNLKEDIFVVLNANRNQFRKRQDITIAAFAKFAKDRPDAQLYMHCGLKDQGWDLLPLFAKEMQKHNLDPNGRIILTNNNQGPPDVSVETLNLIYNSADVGVNTCKGGGFELVNFENAACQVAQVVPDHTSTKEIFQGYGQLIRCDHIDVDTNFSRELPCPSSDHLAEIFADLYENREKLDATAELCYQRVLDPCFSWDNIAAQFNGVFEDMLNGIDHTVEEEPTPKEKKKKKEKREKRLVGAV